MATENLKLISIEVCFYKSDWRNRILTRSKYGHVNVRLPFSYYLNKTKDERYKGCQEVSLYPWQPCFFLPCIVPVLYVEQCVHYCETPIRWRTFIPHNCMSSVSLALTGRWDRLRTMGQIIRYISHPSRQNPT
jgi:hypothetical protein